MLMRLLLDPREGRMWAGCQESQGMLLESWNFQSHSLTCRLNGSPLTIDLISDAYNKASLKTQEDRVWRVSRLMNTLRSGENGMLQEQEIPASFPHT